jgi:hypothetical protein
VNPTDLPAFSPGFSNRWNVPPADTVGTQIQRIDKLQLGVGVAEVVTVQLDNTGKIVKAWSQWVTGIGVAADSSIGYAIRHSNDPPTAGTISGAEISLKLVGHDAGASLEYDGKDLSGTAGLDNVFAQAGTDGWVGVGGIGVGASLGAYKLTVGSPTPIDDPNSLVDKTIFDIIAAMFGPSPSLPTDVATEHGSRTDLGKEGPQAHINPNEGGTAGLDNGKVTSPMVLPGNAKIGFGSTPIENTKWVDYYFNGQQIGIYVDVDTSSAGFTSTPIYITSLGGQGHHWRTVGASSIYEATPTSFRIYLQGLDAITQQFANENNWHIQWIGIGSA